MKRNSAVLALCTCSCHWVPCHYAHEWHCCYECPSCQQKLKVSTRCIKAGLRLPANQQQTAWDKSLARTAAMHRKKCVGPQGWLPLHG